MTMLLLITISFLSLYCYYYHCFRYCDGAAPAGFFCKAATGTEASWYLYT